VDSDGSLPKDQTMFFDPMLTMRRLLEAIPQPRRRVAWTDTTSPGASVAGFGCCPVCHEFVRIETLSSATNVLCPSCGRLIRSLDPLGSDRSLGFTDEL
jgi:hypothetical protein